MKSDVIIIGAILPLVFAALVVIFGQSYTFAYFLIVIAILLVLIIAMKEIHLRFPKVYFKRGEASKSASRIYEEASENGGRLIATHIRPIKLSPGEDIAVEKLKKVKELLEYERFIVIEDKTLEEEWIKNTLKELDRQIETSIYSIKPSLVPSVFWSAIPRANILMYNSGTKYICLLGLDRLQTSDPRYENVNFAIEFRNKKAFDTLRRYFESITANKHVKRIKTVSDYTDRLEEKIIESKIQSILCKFINLGEESREIFHIGIFGKNAISLNGFQSFVNLEELESDIDIMIIVEQRKIEDIKKKISEIVESSDNLEIVWGDDLQYFYYFRTEGKITLDIEIHEKGAEFYEKHPLLGCSIFAYYHMSYMKNGSGYLYDLLRLPYGFYSSSKRFRILLEDRKGLNEFKTKLEEDSIEIDPRRVISICLRNLSWAISGVRPLNSNIALTFLSGVWGEIFKSVKMDEIRNVLIKSQGEVRKEYVTYRDLCKKMISDAIEYSNQQLIE